MPCQSIHLREETYRFTVHLHSDYLPVLPLTVLPSAAGAGQLSSAKFGPHVGTSPTFQTRDTLLYHQYLRSARPPNLSGTKPHRENFQHSCRRPCRKFPSGDYLVSS